VNAARDNLCVSRSETGDVGSTTGVHAQRHERISPIKRLTLGWVSASPGADIMPLERAGRHDDRIIGQERTAIALTVRYQVTRSTAEREVHIRSGVLSMNYHHLAS
jgi:hypothetical protein